MMVRFIMYIISAFIVGAFINHLGLTDDVPSVMLDTFAIIALYRTCVYNKEEK